LPKRSYETPTLGFTFFQSGTPFTAGNRARARKGRPAGDAPGRPIEAVVPQAEVERGPLDHPLVLRVDAQIVGVLDHLERRRPDRDRLGHAVPEGVGPRTRDLVLVVILAFAPEIVLLHEVPDLEAVRAVMYDAEKRLLYLLTKRRV